MNTRFAVVIGLDVGKSGHHACALDLDGEKLFDKPLPQDEATLRDLFTGLQDRGEVLMVVDQPNTIGALPIAVARDCGCAVAYLPGLAMRKAADLYPGRSKTDARDAFIIADTARTMPHTLRQVDRDSEVLSALKVLAGFDEDLAHETTRALNRIRSLLTQIHPALERVFTGSTLSTALVLDLLEKFAGPTGFNAAGRARVLRFARTHSRRDPQALVDQIFTALGEQTVVVPATAAVEVVIPRVAGQVKELKQQRATVAREVETMLEDFPLASVLMSMPGIGIKTAAQILLNIGDGTAFESAGHLAAYAGIAPVTRRSGTSIRGEFPARSGNKRLKNALFYSAWVASNHDPTSKAYYDRKRAEGKRHNAAVICLARRRCNVIYAMLRDGTYYQPPTTTPTPSQSPSQLDSEHRPPMHSHTSRHHAEQRKVRAYLRTAHQTHAVRATVQTARPHVPSEILGYLRAEGGHGSPLEAGQVSRGDPCHERRAGHSHHVSGGGGELVRHLLDPDQAVRLDGMQRIKDKLPDARARHRPSPCRPAGLRIVIHPSGAHLFIFSRTLVPTKPDICGFFDLLSSIFALFCTYVHIISCCSAARHLH